MNFEIEEIYNKIPYDDQTLFSDLPFSKNKNHEFIKSLAFNGVLQEHKFNSMGYRCDDFKKNHDGLHIVFTGCSMTWGSALNIEDTWSYMLYNKIKSIKQCSGYFNLAMPGSSIMIQIINLFKYFKEYGNPNIIIINFPNPLRFFYYSKKENKILDAEYKGDVEHILNLISYHYYFMLEQYCNDNNILLISFTWDQESKNYPLNNFKTFYKINNDHQLNFIYEYKKISNHKNPEFANDGAHFGIAYHTYWANIIYEELLKYDYSWN